MDSKFYLAVVRYLTDILENLEKHHYEEEVMLKILKKLFDLALEDRNLDLRVACEFCLVKFFKVSSVKNTSNVILFQKLQTDYQNNMSILLKKYESYNMNNYKTSSTGGSSLGVNLRVPSGNSYSNYRQSPNRSAGSDSASISEIATEIQNLNFGETSVGSNDGLSGHRNLSNSSSGYKKSGLRIEGYLKVNLIFDA